MAKVYVPGLDGPVEAEGDLFDGGNAFHGVPDAPGRTKRKLYISGGFSTDRDKMKPASIKMIDKKLESLSRSYKKQTKTLEESKQRLIEEVAAVDTDS